LDAKSVKVPLASGAVLPAREVVARKGDYQENILYWTRLGNYLPTTAGEQKTARLESGLKGFVPDGGLFRCSVAGDDPNASFQTLQRFIPEMIYSVPQLHRVGLIGTTVAQEISRVA
jgi:EpsI family protein